MSKSCERGEVTMRLCLLPMLASVACAADWSFREFLAGEWDMERQAAGARPPHPAAWLRLVEPRRHNPSAQVQSTTHTTRSRLWERASRGRTTRTASSARRTRCSCASSLTTRAGKSAPFSSLRPWHPSSQRVTSRRRRSCNRSRNRPSTSTSARRATDASTSPSRGACAVE